MKKLINIGLIAMFAIAAAVILVWMFSGDINGPTANVSPMLWVAYTFLALGILLMVGLTIANMGKSRNKSRIGFFVWGAVIAAGVVLYFVGSPEAVTGADGTVFDDVFTLKTTDMMLYLAYATLGFTVLGMVGGEIWKALK